MLKEIFVFEGEKELAIRLLQECGIEDIDDHEDGSLIYRTKTPDQDSLALHVLWS